MNQADPQPSAPISPAACGETVFPPWWEETLLGALGLARSGATAPEFIEALHFFNTQWVGGDGVDYNDKRADLRAYACFYMPANMPKLWLMLDRAPGLPAGLGAKPWRIRELGCGPGTFLWAALLWLEQRAPDALRNLTAVTGVDRHPGFLAIARRIGDALAARPAFRHLRFEFVRADWREAPPAADEFALFGNVLNEADADEPAHLAALPAAAVALIEPGTCKTFHRLLPVRDALAAAGWQVVFPCPCAAAPCPMPADNWCHFAVNRFRLPLVQSLAAKAGRLNPRHNFCGFLFLRPDMCPPQSEIVNRKSEIPSWRVLSHLRKANRSGIRWLCDGSCLREVVLGRRDRTDGNRAFLEAEWGDLLEIAPGASRNNPGKTSRIAGDDRVTTVPAHTSSMQSP